MMLNDYTFIESGSRSVTYEGETMRLVNFRGIDETSIPHEKLTVDGNFLMSVEDYFAAGVEGKLPEVIKGYVIERLSE